MDIPLRVLDEYRGMRLQGVEVARNVAIVMRKGKLTREGAAKVAERTAAVYAEAEKREAFTASFWESLNAALAEEGTHHANDSCGE